MEGTGKTGRYNIEIVQKTFNDLFSDQGLVFYTVLLENRFAPSIVLRYFPSVQLT